METRPHTNFPDPKIPRVSTKSMFNSVLGILNLERGIFYTSWEMIKSPGQAMNRYLFEDRSRFIDPLKLLVLTIPIYLFLMINVFPEASFFTGMEEGFNNNSEGDSLSEKSAQFKLFIEYLKRYSNFLLLLTVPISAIWTYWLFKSYRLNYGEHLVLNAYLYGFLTLVSIILAPLNFISVTFTGYFLMILSFLYQAYFIQSFFRKSWLKSTLYSILLLALSFFSSFVGLLVLVVIVVGFMLAG